MALAFVVFHSIYLFLSVCIRVNLWLKLFDGLALVGPSRPSQTKIGPGLPHERDDALPGELELVPAGDDDR